MPELWGVSLHFKKDCAINFSLMAKKESPILAEYLTRINTAVVERANLRPTRKDLKTAATKAIEGDQLAKAIEILGQAPKAPTKEQIAQQVANIEEAFALYLQTLTEAGVAPMVVLVSETDFSLEEEPKKAKEKPAKPEKIGPTKLTIDDELVSAKLLLKEGVLDEIGKVIDGAVEQLGRERLPAGKKWAPTLKEAVEQAAVKRDEKPMTDEEFKRSVERILAMIDKLAINSRGWHQVPKDYKALWFIKTATEATRKSEKTAMLSTLLEKAAELTDFALKVQDGIVISKA